MSMSLSSQGILQASPYLRKFPNLHVAGKDIPPPQPQRARPGLLFGALFPPQMSPQLMYISPHLRQCSITDPTSTREAGLGGFSGWIRRNTLFISNNPVGCWWIPVLFASHVIRSDEPQLSEFSIVINVLRPAPALAATLLCANTYHWAITPSSSPELGCWQKTKVSLAPQTQSHHQAKGGVIYCRQLSFPKGFHCQEFSPNQCYQSHS